MIGLIVYHKNIGQYPPEWIEKFKQSILNQTYKDFVIFELNYGGGVEQIFETSYFESVEMPNFVHAMNYLIEKCLSGGFEAIANCNCDDYFSLDRFEKQIEYIRQGYDLVSSNFSLVKNDEITLTHEFHNRDIEKELDKKHNMVCHPVVMGSRKFWEGNRYDTERIPVEDMELWTRAIKAGYKFIILPDVLCYHRLHDNSVGHNLKEK